MEGLLSTGPTRLVRIGLEVGGKSYFYVFAGRLGNADSLVRVINDSDGGCFS